MTEPRIRMFEVDQWAREYIDARGFEYKIEMVHDPLTEANCSAASDADVVSIFIYSSLTRVVLECLKNVKLVCTRSTGYDHIDIAACNEMGITVCNVPRYGENTVAEHAFALILALSRRIKTAITRTNQLNFYTEGLRGFDLKDKTLGVIGAGAIGLHAIRIGRGFGMNVLASDAFPHPILAEVLGFEYAPIERVLSESDVISIHVPLLESTYHLINKDTIKKIKPGAILVNTSRGGVVETEALVLGLDEGILSGVGLDVLEGEETIKEEAQLISDSLPVEKLRAVIRSYALLHRDNVIITPHVGFYSVEAEHRIIDTKLDNIYGFIEGEPRNVVS